MREFECIVLKKILKKKKILSERNLMNCIVEYSPFREVTLQKVIFLIFESFEQQYPFFF